VTQPAKVVRSVKEKAIHSRQSREDVIADADLTENQKVFAQYVAWFRTLNKQCQIEQARWLQDDFAKQFATE
jgi:hypothetical protein